MTDCIVWHLNLIWIEIILNWNRKWLVSMNGWKAQLFLICHSSNSSAIDVMVDPSVLDEKSSFEMLGLSFFSELDLGSYINFVSKLDALLCSARFLPSGVTLYLSKSTMKFFLSRLHFSLFHLMRATARAHASTRGSSLMHVKNGMPHFCL